MWVRFINCWQHSLPACKLQHFRAFPLPHFSTVLEIFNLNITCCVFNTFAGQKMIEIMNNDKTVRLQFVTFLSDFVN